MAENMQLNQRKGTGKKKKKRRSTLRLSVILIFFIMCIVISFVIYAMNFDISSKPVSVNSPGTKPAEENIIVTDAAGNPVTDSSGNTVTEKNKVTLPVSTAQSIINPVAASEKRDEAYLTSSVFIGDSITTGLSGYHFVPDENVLADIGLRIDNITDKTVSNPRYSEPVDVMTAISSIQPENVYILLGSNGVSWLDGDKMYTAYSDFVDSIREALPNADIYIISITPVGTMKENIESVDSGRVLNSEIDAFNERLFNLANEKGVAYLDVNSELKDENGKLPDDVTSDGMHFNKKTYEKFVEYILTHTIKK